MQPLSRSTISCMYGFCLCGVWLLAEDSVRSFNALWSTKRQHSRRTWITRWETTSNIKTRLIIIVNWLSIWCHRNITPGSTDREHCVANPFIRVDGQPQDLTVGNSEEGKQRSINIQIDIDHDDSKLGPSKGPRVGKSCHIMHHASCHTRASLHFTTGKTRRRKLQLKVRSASRWPWWRVEIAFIPRNYLYEL